MAAKNAAPRSKPLRSAAERRGEVEPEAVDMAHLDPVPQRVHHHLQHARMRQVQRVAAAGEVVVVARRVRLEPIVRRVVDAAETERRAEMVAFGGVVVDDVEDDLDAGVVQARHRRAKFLKTAVERITLLGREEAERVVAPIVD